LKLQVFIVLLFVNIVEKYLTFTFLCVIIVTDNKDRFRKIWIWKKLDICAQSCYNNYVEFKKV